MTAVVLCVLIVCSLGKQQLLSSWEQFVNHLLFSLTSSPSYIVIGFHPFVSYRPDKRWRRKAKTNHSCTFIPQ